MHIALTGCSGFIGSYLARLLHDHGHTISGLVRESSRRDHIEPFIETFVVGPHDDASCWPALLEDADLVIHNSVDWSLIKNPDDIDQHLTSNLLGSLRFLYASAPRPFIYLSTIAVHHDMCERWGGNIEEDHPLRPGNTYGAHKAAMEAFLHAEHHGNGRRVAALRPCAVYGIDPTLKRSIGWPIIRKLQRGEPIDRAGGGKFVHIDDVAAAVVRCAEDETTNGRVYNLVDCYTRWSDWAKIAAEELDLNVEIEHNSPAEPKNIFKKDAAHSLGITMDRGQEGIRQHLRELITKMSE